MKKYNTVKINKLIILGVIFLFALIIFKLFVVGTFKKVDGINLKEFAESRDVVKKKLTAKRGTIRDRNGEILAQSVNSYTVIAYLSSSRTDDKDNPQHVVDKEYTAKKLSPLINMSEKKILNLLKTDAYQVELGPGGRGISELTKEEIEKLSLPGIDFVASTKRYYPYGDFMSYTIGYAKENNKNEIIGEFGAELMYDDILTGKNGYREYQQDIYGYQIANTPSITKEPENGKDIYLTTDINIQMFLEQAVKKVKASGASWVTFTAADAKTGDILATATKPSFNPNKKNITNYHDPLVSYAYEPGSTMKIFSFMAAMENNLYNGSETYTSGHIVVDDAKIKDWNKYGWGVITYDTGFMASSNVAATNLGFKLGRNKLMDYYKLLGFGSKTGVGLPNEFSGQLNFKYKTEVATASFGQGILTTPVQNIKALTSIANDGVELKPHIVSKIVDPDTGKVVEKTKREELGSVATKETVDKIKKLMESVVSGNPTYATGVDYNVPNYHLIGKTGTAEIASSSGSYLKDSYIKSFAGIFPKDDPQIILYISAYGFNGVLADAVKPAIESIGKYINVEKDTQNVANLYEYKMDSFINKKTTTSKEILTNNKMKVYLIGAGDKVINQYPNKNTRLNYNTKVFLLTNNTNFTMPNMSGWSTSEINEYANLIGMKVEYNGYGFCKTQSISAGSKIDASTKLKVTLKPKYKS